MTGGGRREGQAVRTLFRCDGIEDWFFYGDAPGNSQVARLVNNMILGITMNGVADGVKLLASHAIAEKPGIEFCCRRAPGQRFWQGRFSPDGRWVSFVVERADRPEHLEMGVAAAGGVEAGTWKLRSSIPTCPARRKWISRDVGSR